MKYIRLALVALLCAMPASSQAWWQSIQQVGVSGGGACSQYTTFIARTSGTSPTEQSAYQAMICGMVSDGTWSLLDALYIFATNTTATANLNLVSTSFGVTLNTTVTFTADLGYTNAGAPNFIDTGFNPSTAGGNYSLNSATIGIYDQTGTGISPQVLLGARSTAYAYFQPDPAGGGSAFYDINAANFPSFANTSARAAWTLTRTGSAALAVYKNGASVTTSSGTSTSLPNNNIYISALNDSGSAADESVDTFSAAWIGGGLNSTQAIAVNNRVNAYMTALGINVY